MKISSFAFTMLLSVASSAFAGDKFQYLVAFERMGAEAKIAEYAGITLYGESAAFSNVETAAFVQACDAMTGALTPGHVTTGTAIQIKPEEKTADGRVKTSITVEHSELAALEEKSIGECKVQIPVMKPNFKHSTVVYLVPGQRTVFATSPQDGFQVSILLNKS
ncbi:MAG TPA: hypothetical protein VEC35_09430 [Noviherbaspirillum sp.]|nr:hypothetical protein [Noviherbaspirillum sp.]